MKQYVLFLPKIQSDDNENSNINSFVLTSSSATTPVSTNTTNNDTNNNINEWNFQTIQRSTSKQDITLSRFSDLAYSFSKTPEVDNVRMSSIPSLRYNVSIESDGSLGISIDNYLYAS